jgi:hypothetical protein
MLVFALVFIGCEKGTTNSTNGMGGPETTNGINDTGKLVGIWVDEADGSETVFNTDGTGSSDGTSFKYGVAGNKLACILTQRGQLITTVWDLYISSDGKTLILSRGAANVTSANGSLLRKAD